MRKNLGRVSHNKCNAIIRCLEENKSIKEKLIIKSNKKNQMFSKVQDLLAKEI